MAFRSRSLPDGLFGFLASDQSRPGVGADAIDGIVPAVVVTPRREDELVMIVKEARDAGLALITAGSGSALSIGNSPRAYDVLISMARMASVIEHNPDDLTVTTQTGISLEALNRQLSTSGQRVAIDLPSESLATVGGLLATDRTGGFARGFGSPRDMALGVSAVDGRGRIIRSGGRVVKNVAGYDLTRLFAGSYGTLGILTDVSLRTTALPVQARTLIFQVDGPNVVDEVRRSASISELPLAALDFQADADAWILAARIEGEGTEIAYQQARLEEACGGYPHSITLDWSSPIHPKPTEELVMRLGSVPARADQLTAELLAKLSANEPSIRMSGRLGDGLVRLCADGGASTEVRTLISCVLTIARTHQASVVLERASLEAKAGLDVWGAKPPGAPLMVGLKRAFDPDSLFAPGRFVSGI